MSASIEVDAVLLARHIARLDEMCEHWSQVLIEAEPVAIRSLNKASVSEEAGVYIFHHDGQVKYIGKSKNLRKRICTQHLGSNKRQSTLRRKVSRHLGTDDEAFISKWLETTTVAWLPLGSHRLTLAVEDYAVEKFKPPLNG